MRYDDGVSRLIRRSDHTTAHSVDDAYASVREMIRSRAADAAFAANNRATMGALRAFADEGQRLPLIGFDEFEAATVVRPAISVVSQNIAAMGALAAEIILQRLDGDLGSARLEVSPIRLVLRGSELAE